MNKKHFPPLQWLSGYSLKTLRSDAIAGITLTAYAIPVSLAYATLAGLPPQYGVFGYLLGGLFYAMLGTGRQLAIGPTSAISMLIGTTLAGLSGGDLQRWMELASLTALVFAGMSVLAYILRLDSIINFISETVLVGFKAGAALSIMLAQLPIMFGLTGGGHDFFSQLGTFIHQLPDTNFHVFIFGILGFALILAGEKYFHGKPVAIVVVFLSIIIISFTSLASTGFTTVGVIPAGLPNFQIPSINWIDIQSVGSLAFACFLLAYIESVSAAMALAQKNGYEIDPHQELLALGLANLATSLGGGYPVSGGLSQSAISDDGGAKTPLSLVVASVCIGLSLMFLTGLLKNLPTVILAAIVFISVEKLINIKEFLRMWRVNKFDFVIALLALISVICFGILPGVLIGALASLLLIIKAVSSPHIAFLGRIPGTERFTDIKRHPDNELLAGVILFRVESPLVYFNVSYVYNHVWPKITESASTLKVVIFDLSTSAYIDSSGARLIKKFFLQLEERGIIFKVAEAHSEVRDVLRFEDVEHLLGHVGRRDSIHDVIAHTLTEAEIQEKVKVRCGLTVSLCLWIVITGALQAHADDVKPSNDHKRTTVSETVKTAVVTTKPAEEEEPTGDVSLSVLSTDYSKGVESSRNSAVIQPSWTVSYKGFTANVCGSLDTGPYQTPANKTKKNTWTETDINLSYSKTLGMVNLGAGYSYFTDNPPFDGAAKSDDQQEVNATVGLDLLFNPTLTVYKLFDKGRRWYIQMDVSHAFEFNKTVSLKVAGKAGYLIGGDAANATEARFDDHANQTTDQYSAFLDGVLTASVPVKVTDRITITPTASYAFPLGTDAKNYMKGNGLETVTNNSDRASSFLFGGVIMGFSF